MKVYIALKRTILTAAYEDERYNLVSALIKAEANVNQSNGYTSLLLAECVKGRWRAGHELIKTGADVNKSDENKSPHTTAYESGHLNVDEAFRKKNVHFNQSWLYNINNCNT